MLFRRRKTLVPKIALAAFVVSWLVAFISAERLPESDIAMVAMIAFLGVVGLCFIALVAWVAVAIVNLHLHDRSGVYMGTKDGTEKFYARAVGRTSGYVDVASRTPRQRQWPHLPEIPNQYDPEYLRARGNGGQHHANE